MTVTRRTTPQARTQTHPAPTVLTGPIPFSYKLEQKQIKPYNVKHELWLNEKGFIKLFSSCFSLGLYKKENGAMLHKGGLEFDAESSGCHEDKKPRSICWACRWASCVFFLILCLMFETFTPSSRPRRPRFFCLKIVVDKCLDIQLPCCPFLCLLYCFSSGLLWGGGMMVV